MKVKIIIVSLLAIIILMLSGCTEHISDSGIITDKWSKIVDADFGSREAYFFEIDNEYFIEVGTFDYYNYQINQTYNFSDKIKNPNI